MENKLEKIGQNNFMDNFVKTDDILKDMCGIIRIFTKSCISGGQYNADNREIGSLVIESQVKNCRARTGQNMVLKL